jgi:hypothetical protein
MFDILQIAVKLLIISFFVVLALIASLRVWRAELDLRQLLSPRRALEGSVADKLAWLPTRDAGGLYQGGEVVAKVSGSKVDEDKHVVLFDEVYESNSLKLDEEFEFQKWRLRFKSADKIDGLNSSQPQKGRIMSKVLCTIIGPRSPL